MMDLLSGATSRWMRRLIRAVLRGYEDSTYVPLRGTHRISTKKVSVLYAFATVPVVIVQDIKDISLFN
jgi:hypothetical protein